MLTDEFQIVRARYRKTVAMRLPRPFSDSSMGPFESRSLASVSLCDADGTWGHALVDGNHSLEQLVLGLLKMGRKKYTEVYSALYWSVRNSGFRGPAASTVGMVDLALHDLAAQRQQVPLHRMLGATRDWAQAYASGGSVTATESELVEEMLGYAQAGFTTLKMKVGRDFGRRMQEDVARVRAVRKALGVGIRLAVDANQVWSPADAIEFAERIAEHQIAWFEEPVHSADLGALEEYCAKAPVPAAVGESERSAKVFPMLVRAGAGYLQPQPEKLAGVDEWLGVSELGQRHRRRLTLPGTPQIGCLFGATSAEETLCEILFPLQVAPSVFYLRWPELKGDRFLLDSQPGLPLTVDWERLTAEGQVEADVSWPS